MSRLSRINGLSVRYSQHRTPQFLGAITAAILYKTAFLQVTFYRKVDEDGLQKTHRENSGLETASTHVKSDPVLESQPLLRQRSSVDEIYP